jgi:hypothetical protein
MTEVVEEWVLLGWNMPVCRACVVGGVVENTAVPADDLRSLLKAALYSCCSAGGIRVKFLNVLVRREVSRNKLALPSCILEIARIRQTELKSKKSSFQPRGDGCKHCVVR